MTSGAAGVVMASVAPAISDGLIESASACVPVVTVLTTLRVKFAFATSFSSVAPMTMFPLESISDWSFDVMPLNAQNLSGSPVPSWQETV